MHAALEELSSLIEVDATFQTDGTVSLMLNGETPLLLDDKQYALGSSLYQPQEPPPVNPGGPGGDAHHGFRRQRHYGEDDRGAVGCAAETAQSDPALHHGGRYPGGQFECDGEAVRRSRE